MTGEQILSLPMDPKTNDAGADSIRAFYRALLSALLRDGDGFSGKRPFGNSGWDFDLYAALIKGGAIKGKFDSDGCIEEVDTHEADLLLIAAARAL